MYSPTTRLLTVLELLQAYRRISGPEIARRLEIDVRTVRRYITVLQDMGIPVEAERGPHGAYQLHRGHKLPPLMFTDGEAVALSLGLLAIRQLRFVVDAASVEGALAKTEHVMPENLLQQVRALQETIAFKLPPVTSSQQAFVMLLSAAVQQQKQVCLRYRSGNGDESERMFDPYGIVQIDSGWYTAGYCHLRESLRTFRLDRVTALQPGEASFERPDDFDVMAHVLSSLRYHRKTTPVEVLLKTTLDEAQQFITPDIGTLEVTDAGVIFRRAAYHLDRVAHHMLTLPFPVKILQPRELRDLVRQMAAKAFDMVDDEA